ncbi:glycosyl transferase [Roseospira navarrensis]|uniref:Glycosyl transferase n=2 Tax=Roseospira navarrensis TaxID=140058 RepID=A0A7X2D4P8_9PROT|nr:glycosyl transferase [Roseospira navarrensis]
MPPEAAGGAPLSLVSASLTSASGPLVLAVAAAVLSLIAVRLLERWLHARAVLDHPNDRSSHAVPTPRGGGLGLLAAALPLLIWDALSSGTGGPALPWVMLVGGVGLAALSWRDDLRPLPAIPRLSGHLLACYGALWALPLPGPVFQGLLPGPLDMLAAGLLWAWFVNLFNFMDGIDGISGVQTIALGTALALVAAATAVPLPVAAPLILAGAAAGFLVWNWHPARIFLGDVGSVPLGYLLGGMLLMLAAHGQWAAALIAPLYYLADATLTLLGRLARGHSPTQAHRDHAYQVAVRAGLSHARVSMVVAGLNALLVALALATAAGPLPAAVAVALAALLVGGVLSVMRWRPLWLGPVRAASGG